MTACASASAAVSRFSATSRRIEELYDARLSVAAIARKLNEENVPTPCRGTTATPTGISGALVRSPGRGILLCRLTLRHCPDYVPATVDP
jgi:hypothetical protein